ncbi:MAG TPA: CaiB/BaiF CoA-transferase family protein [Candidatus Dormibacteraeota bacterium]|jgi:crotonobetainyl-CoA:carnitine CoA-transferase CaiB-like acyl-CoA transferase
MCFTVVFTAQSVLLVIHVWSSDKGTTPGSGDVKENDLVMPLSGIRVLDLTRLLPGPFCTMLLADMGADVIKIEDPDGGDYMRWSPPLIDGQSVLFNAVNRNKRSVSVNLKSEPGRDLLLRLVDGADVLVEGNRPGVMKRLGLGWDVVHPRNPRLVMCSITGYGQDGPFAARAGHDLNYMATAGGLGLNGEKSTPPVPLSVQVADIGGGGLQPAVAILGALVAVQRGAEGRWLDVSMTDGAVSWLALALAARGAGEVVGRGDQRLSGRNACYRVYACKDGGFYSVGALEPKFWAALCAAVERPDLVAVQFAEGAEAEVVHREMEAVFASRTRSEWEVALAGLEVCCEPVLELDEVASHPQVAARGLIAKRKTGVEVRPAVQLHSDWRRLDPPGLGEHNAEVLAEVGVDAHRLGELKAQGVI